MSRFLGVIPLEDNFNTNLSILQHKEFQKTHCYLYLKILLGEKRYIQHGSSTWDIKNTYLTLQLQLWNEDSQATVSSFQILKSLGNIQKLN